MVAIPTIVSRAEWGAVPPIRTHQIVLPTPELWLHHSAGAGEDEPTIRRIQNFHMAPEPVGRGWSDIAYSFLIDDDAPDVDIFEGRGVGRAGGHTKGHNTISHALCVIGNYMTRLPQPKTLDRLVELAAVGAVAGWWRVGFSGGHRDASGAATSCPGDALWRIIPQLNTRIKARVEAIMDLPFEDLQGWPEEVIAAARWAKENGITQGTSATSFSPEQPITRAQAIVFMHRAAQLNNR